MLQGTDQYGIPSIVFRMAVKIWRAPSQGTAMPIWRRTDSRVPRNT